MKKLYKNKSSKTKLIGDKNQNDSQLCQKRDHTQSIRKKFLQYSLAMLKFWKHNVLILS